MIAVTSETRKRRLAVVVFTLTFASINYLLKDLGVRDKGWLIPRFAGAQRHKV